MRIDSEHGGSMVRPPVLLAFALAVAAAAAWTFLPLGVSHTTTTSVFPGGGVEPVTTIQSSRAWHSPRVLFIIWLPVLVASAPLLRGSHRFDVAVTVIAAVLLSTFVVIAGFSIGLFYAPAAVVMSIAAVRALKAPADTGRLPRHDG